VCVWRDAVWCGVCCSVLQSIAMDCSELQCVAVCCSVLQCVAVCCSELQCVAVSCSVLQCAAEYCNGLQWVAVCCSELQCVAVSVGTLFTRQIANYVAPHVMCVFTPHTHTHLTCWASWSSICGVMRAPTDTATHCNTLQHTATHCNTPHTHTHLTCGASWFAICRMKTVPTDTATHCNTLQHTAKNCNTPQHTTHTHTPDMRSFMIRNLPREKSAHRTPLKNFLQNILIYIYFLNFQTSALQPIYSFYTVIYIISLCTRYFSPGQVWEFLILREFLTLKNHLQNILATIIQRSTVFACFTAL